MRPHQVKCKEPLATNKCFEEAFDEYLRDYFKNIKASKTDKEKEADQKFWAELIEKAK
jgi:hypothetical protein